MSNVAFHVNENTPKIRFLASLSDGRTVIEDHIPDQRSAWIRLKEFLKNNKDIKITCLRLQFPNFHKPQEVKEITMPANQKGYCFGKKKQVVFPFGGHMEFTCIGYFDGEKAYIQWFNNQNYAETHNEERSKEKAGFFLIEN